MKTDSVQFTYGPLSKLCHRESAETNYAGHDSIQDTWPVDDLSLDIYSCEFESDYDALAAVIQTLGISDTVKALINEAVSQGWEAGLADLAGYDFHIDVPSKQILLHNKGLSPLALMRSPCFTYDLQISMLRALRDIWHEKRHGGFDEQFAPADIMLLERVRAADCDVMTVLAAWELRIASHGGLWRHILALGEGDLAVTFSTTLEKEAASYPVHKALAASFRQWYRDAGRIAACDHETLEYLDQLLLAYPGGQAFGKMRAAAINVEALSCLPDRTAYLQNCGGDILVDPFYAGLNTELNQSHFMQIMHDTQATYTQGIAFRDAELAAKIFPGGNFTPEKDSVSETTPF